MFLCMKQIHGIDKHYVINDYKLRFLCMSFCSSFIVAAHQEL